MHTLEPLAFGPSALDPVTAAEWHPLDVLRLVLLVVIGVGGIWWMVGGQVRRDVTKFRGWRERVQRWKADSTAPLPEYIRDNHRWVMRIGSGVIGALGFAGLVVLLATSAHPWDWGWKEISAAVVGVVGASTWNLLDDYVR